MNRRKSLIVAFIAITLIPLGGVGVWHAYHEFKIYRFTSLGDKSIEDGNWRLASFWYKQALDNNPDDKNVILKLCTYSNYYDDPDAPFFWKERSRLESHSSESQIGLIRSLLRNGRYDEAKYQISESDLTDHPGEFHELIAGYHLSTGNFIESEKYARKALFKSPDLVNGKLLLLNILMRQGHSNNASEIEKLIKEISSREENLPDLWRVFIDYSVNTGNREQAYIFLKKLAYHHDSHWNEKLEFLKLMLDFESDQIMYYLYDLDDIEPIFLEKVSSLLTSNQLPELSMLWLKAYDTNRFNHSLSFQISYADTLSKLKKWQDLINYLKEKNWKQFDYYRNALLSLSFKESGKHLESQRAWKKCMIESYQVINEQLRLAQMVETWNGFKKKWISLLEEMLAHSVHKSWAYKKLHKYYLKKGETWNLYRISIKALKNLSNNSKIQSNAVFYSLLLDKNLLKNLIDAKIQYDKNPDSSPCDTLNYALALYKNNEFKTALNIMKTLENKILDIPEFAYYAAIFNKAVSNETETKNFLIKSEGALLLPEEKALFNESIN